MEEINLQFEKRVNQSLKETYDQALLYIAELEKRYERLEHAAIVASVNLDLSKYDDDDWVRELRLACGWSPVKVKTKDSKEKE